MTVETAPRVAPAEPTTPIRPSEALRLGRLLRPLPFSGDLFGDEGEACALGAILAGSGFDGGSWGDFNRTLFEALGEPSPACPALDGMCRFHGGLSNLRVAIYSLNDIHEWNDTQIVAWLESLGL